ncbi:hypothetical protein O2W14_09260 [Modestobacter sp. VKM Ac-2986]|uniref:hypothetical protein n=1 Tax=Modestobacter sp. VKM Ac-2986 TaxID=3004140 RepID=UPI0022AA777F|nr:hypothetical protein [Modestobacter sp. VKM Ac-2986]MCZ2829019.1 hypothetical protein [Modestobacter sp. VKM Ac-2986]
MRHPTEGVLRRLVDEPAGVSDADRSHVADCATCLAGLATAREDAATVHAALDTGGPDAELPAAWQRLTTGLAADAPRPARARTRRSRELFRRPVVATVAVGVVLAGAGTAAANDWLPVFRTEAVQPVAFDTADLVALPDLTGYGDLVVSGEPDVHAVTDAATAAAESGLSVPEVAELPDGITGSPTYQVGDQVTATFTYSADRAAASAAAAGEPLPPTPAGLDGSAVQLVAGPGVAQVFESRTGVPGLVVGRAVAPTASSSGVPFDTLRDHLLSLPGLPDDVAAQLATFTADGGTLPLPVPADRVTTSATDVDGVPATVLETRDGLLSAVVWVSEGTVTVVAGSLDPDEVLEVARELR